MTNVSVIVWHPSKPQCVDPNNRLLYKYGIKLCGTNRFRLRCFFGKGFHLPATYTHYTVHQSSGRNSLPYPADYRAPCWTKRSELNEIFY